MVDFRIVTPSVRSNRFPFIGGGVRFCCEVVRNMSLVQVSLMFQFLKLVTFRIFSL